MKFCQINVNQIHTIYYINHVPSEEGERYDLITRINHNSFDYFMQMMVIHTPGKDHWDDFILLAKDLNEYFFLMYYLAARMRQKYIVSNYD